MPEKILNSDGSGKEVDGTISLDVSLGVPFVLAEMLHRPLQKAVLADHKLVNGLTEETWRLPDGKTFTVNQLSRFEFAELNKAIGSVKVDDADVLVYQRTPRILHVSGNL